MAWVLLREIDNPQQQMALFGKQSARQKETATKEVKKKELVGLEGAGERYLRRNKITVSGRRGACAEN